MQAIRATQALNKAELENATPPNASWHRDYKDTAYIYIGGLPLDLSEGDVVTIFSQFGHPTHLNLIRDRETGKSKGFAFLKYEDQRSCDLAVDNLGGAKIFDRMLRVDHTRYKKRDDEDEETYRIDRHEDEINENGKRGSDTDADTDGEEKRRKKSRKMLKSEKELEDMLAIKENGEEEDPMREYLIRTKREEVAAERERQDRRESKHKHRHRHRDGEDRDKDRLQPHRSSRRDEDDHKDRDRNSKHNRRERLEAAGKSRDGRRREHSVSEDESRPKPKRRSPSLDAHDGQQHGRDSRHDSDRKPRDGTRERDHTPRTDRHRNRNDDLERRHRRRKEDTDDQRRRPSSRDRRRSYADDS